MCIEYLPSTWRLGPSCGILLVNRPAVDLGGGGGCICPRGCFAGVFMLGLAERRGGWESCPPLEKSSWRWMDGLSMDQCLTSYALCNLHYYYNLP